MGDKSTAKYFVFDPELYESFSSYEEALACAKADVGEDGWEPCESLVVVKLLAKVTVQPSTKRPPILQEFAKS